VALAYEFPCTRALGATDTLSTESIADLIAWVRWPGARTSRLPARRVEALLRRSLRPVQHRSPDELESLLALLEGSAFPWVWPHLYRAELARIRRDWVQAAAQLGRAADSQPSAGPRARLLWYRAHCLSAAGAADEASRALQAARRAGEPGTPADWALILREERGDADRAHPLAIEALRRFPQDAELVCHVERLSRLTGQWRTVPALAAGVLSEASDDGLRALAQQLECAAALHLRDVALAEAAAGRVTALSARLPEAQSHLRAFAATVLASRAALDTPAARALLVAGRSRPSDRRVQLACWWSTLDGHLRDQALVKPSSLSVDGAHWNMLRQLAQARRSIEDGALDQLGVLIEESSLDVRQRLWLCRAGLEAARQVDVPAGASRLAVLSGDETLREHATAWLRWRWARAWNAGRARPRHAAREALVAFDALASLGALPQDTISWAVLRLIAGERGAQSGDQLGPAPEAPAGPLAALQVYVQWASGVSTDRVRVDEALRCDAGAPLHEWLHACAVADCVATGEFAEAARRLALDDHSPAAVLRAVRAPDHLVAWHEAWLAFRGGQFARSLDLCLHAGGLQAGQLRPGLVLLALAARERASDACGPDEDSGERLRAWSPRWSDDAAEWSELPWTACARAGLHQLTRQLLRRRLAAAGESRPQTLHAYALSALAQAREAAQAGDARAATRSLHAAVGAWAAVLEMDDALDCYVQARQDAYGIASAAARARRGEILGRAVSDIVKPGTTEEHLTLLWDLEVRAIRAVAACGGIVHEPGARISAGPLLVRDLGLGAGVRALVVDAGRRAPADGGKVGLRALARLLGLDLALPPDDADQRVEQAREVRRCFSPVAPAVVLLAERQFDAAAAQLESALAWDTDAPFGFLLDFIGSEDDRRWLEAERAQLLIECHLQKSRDLAGRVPAPVDLVCGAWRAAIRAAPRGSEDEARRLAGEVAIGRFKALLPARTKEQRREDEFDQRPTRQRRAEGLDLLRGAWAVTQAPNVQGPLAEHLNILAVALNDKGKHAAAADTLFEALTVKRNFSRATGNLAALTLNRAADSVDSDPGAAGEIVTSCLQRLAALDPDQSVQEIQECMKQVRAKAVEMLLHTAMAALAEDDWARATDFVAWYQQIQPDHLFVGAVTHRLMERLRREPGPEAVACLKRLHLHLPAPDLLLRELLGVLVADQEASPATAVAGLLQRARDAREAGEFDTAMDFLARAKGLARPRRSERAAVMSAIRETGMAWGRHAQRSGRLGEAFMVALRTQELIDE
jgi:hypothetical protein